MEQSVWEQGVKQQDQNDSLRAQSQEVHMQVCHVGTRCDAEFWGRDDPITQAVSIASNKQSFCPHPSSLCKSTVSIAPIFTLRYNSVISAHCNLHLHPPHLSPPKRRGSCYVAQALLELLTSSNSPTLAPQNAGITDMTCLLNSYSREDRRLEGKLRNRNNFIINKLDVHSEAQSESQQLQRRQEDKYTKMGRNQRKKDENTRNQNTSPPTRGSQLLPSKGTRLDGDGV
ncbi:hypothetical protein AAY473_033962 [Plecturocebus cupreus]